VVSPTRDRAAVVAVLHSKLLVGRNDDLTDPFYISVKEATDFVQGQGKQPSFITRECEQAGMSARKSGCPEKVEAVARQLALETIDRTAMELAAYTATIVGTHLTLDHEGFRGLRGFFVGSILGKGWRSKIFPTNLPALLSRWNGAGPVPGTPEADCHRNAPKPRGEIHCPDTGEEACSIAGTTVRYQYRCAKISATLMENDDGR